MLEYDTLTPSETATRQARNYHSNHPLHTNSVYMPHQQELFPDLINAKKVINKLGIAQVGYTVSDHAQAPYLLIRRREAFDYTLTRIDPHEVEGDRSKLVTVNRVNTASGTTSGGQLLRHRQSSLSTEPTHNDPGHDYELVTNTTVLSIDQPNRTRQNIFPCCAPEQSHDPDEFAMQRHRGRGSPSWLTASPRTPACLATRYLVDAVTEIMDCAQNHSSEGHSTPSRRSRKLAFEAAVKNIIARIKINTSVVLTPLIDYRRSRPHRRIELTIGGDEQASQKATIRAITEYESNKRQRATINSTPTHLTITQRLSKYEQCYESNKCGPHRLRHIIRHQTSFIATDDRRPIVIDTTNCCDSICISDLVYVSVVAKRNGFMRGNSKPKVDNEKCLAIDSISVASRKAPSTTIPLNISLNQARPSSDLTLDTMSRQSTYLPRRPESGQCAPYHAQPERPFGPNFDTGRRSSTGGYSSLALALHRCPNDPQTLSPNFTMVDLDTTPQNIMPPLVSAMSVNRVSPNQQDTAFRRYWVHLDDLPDVVPGLAPPLSKTVPTSSRPLPLPCARL
ncbi:hypothetical protein EDB86DRAFT_3087658 [Lactarius hatsudake]|nr:hypothetical protein EDB86DRAFT_3087658 [Lactarius hatsudake]